MRRGAGWLTLSPPTRGDLDEPQGGLPKNFARPCLLLLLSEGQAHGYDLIVRLVDFGLKVDPGGLYRTLRSFERQGLVRSWWETSDTGPARRTYLITPDGESWLQLWGGTLRESRQLLDRFLTRYEMVVGAEAPVLHGE